jgi:hypothetical protein
MTMLTDTMNVIGWDQGTAGFISYKQTLRRFLQEVEALKEKA